MTYPKGWTESLPLFPLIFSWLFTILLQKVQVNTRNTYK